jgi:hypothetical protein
VDGIANSVNNRRHPLLHVLADGNFETNSLCKDHQSPNIEILVGDFFDLSPILEDFSNDFAQRKRLALSLQVPWQLHHH